MLFDTDVLIWYEKGNTSAARLIDLDESRRISTQTYMELIQGARSQADIQTVKDFLVEFGFEILPFTENIGHRASIYVEEYALSAGIRAGDAIVAATAMENNLVLATGNRKHFKDIRDLKVKILTP